MGSKYRGMKYTLYLENSRDTAGPAIPGQMRSGRALPSKGTVTQKELHNAGGSTAKAFMFKSIFHIAKGKKQMGAQHHAHIYPQQVVQMGAQHQALAVGSAGSSKN